MWAGGYLGLGDPGQGCHPRRSMDDKAIRGFTWTMLSFGGNRVVTVVTTILLAHLLEPADFGLFALATLGINFISIFSGLGMGQTLVMRPDLDRRGQGTILTLLVGAGIAFAVLLAGVSQLLADAFRQPRLADMLLALAALLSFTGFNWFYDSILQRELEFRKRFVSQLLRTVTYATVALTLAFSGAGVWSLVAGFAAGHVANGIALFVLTPYRVPFSFDRRVARSLVRTGRGFVLQDGMDFAQQNVDYLTIGRVLGAQQLGYYTLSFRQAELPYLSIADPVNRVTFPSFAQMRDRGEDAGSPYVVALAMIALAVIPLGAILSGAAAPFVETFFGDKWLPMIGVLSILGVWAAVRPLETAAGWMLNSMGHPGTVGRVSLGLFALQVPAIILAAHGAGIKGVAWVMLGHATVALAVLTTLVDRMVGVTLARQWSTLVPLFAAGALSWVSARLLAVALEGIAPFPALVLCTIGALGTYLVVVRLLQPELLRMAWGRALRAVGRTGRQVPSAPLPQ